MSIFRLLPGTWYIIWYNLHFISILTKVYIWSHFTVRVCKVCCLMISNKYMQFFLEKLLEGEFFSRSWRTHYRSGQWGQWLSGASSSETLILITDSVNMNTFHVKYSIFSLCNISHLQCVHFHYGNLWNFMTLFLIFFLISQIWLTRDSLQKAWCPGGFTGPWPVYLQNGLS